MFGTLQWSVLFSFPVFFQKNKTKKKTCWNSLNVLYVTYPKLQWTEKQTVDGERISKNLPGQTVGAKKCSCDQWTMHAHRQIHDKINRKCVSLVHNKCLENTPYGDAFEIHLYYMYRKRHTHLTSASCITNSVAPSKPNVRVLVKNQINLKTVHWYARGFHRRTWFHCTGQNFCLAIVSLL